MITYDLNDIYWGEAFTISDGFSSPEYTEQGALNSIDQLVILDAGEYSLTIIGQEDSRYSPNSEAMNSFNVSIGLTAVPIPGAVWLFGTGLIGLLGVARSRKG